jgi:hypothetical protein
MVECALCRALWKLLPLEFPSTDSDTPKLFKENGANPGQEAVLFLGISSSSGGSSSTLMRDPWPASPQVD